MNIDLNYEDKNFKDKLLNLPKGIKIINIQGKIDNINNICDILENIQDNIVINTTYKDEINKEFKKRNTYQGFNRSILNMVKKICLENISCYDYVIDMTVGNGFDTLFLANISKKVFGFDIQSKAINITRNLLNKENITNYELINTSHEFVDTVLNKYLHKIKLILFNLGYLPGGDKSITTKSDTTLKALINARNMLTKDGLILIVFYPHEEGKKESKVVLDYLDKFNIKYNVYKNTPNENAPYLVVIS